MKKKKTKDPALKDFRPIPKTALRIKIAWTDEFLCFRPLKKDEKSL